MAADHSCEVAVVGAGLAGLRAADLMVERGIDVRVFEARSRHGGRVLSVPVRDGFAIDLGPAWIWPAYQPDVRALLARFDINSYPQFEAGTFLLEERQGIRLARGIQRYADAARIEGGAGALADALLGVLPEGTIQLNAEVRAVEVDHEVRIGLADGNVWNARKIILAVPPMLIATWRFLPALPDDLLTACRRWPTWMAAHAKYVACYERAFWREQGHSGSAVSHVGPLVEIVDHSATAGSGPFCLFGFAGVPARLRRSDPEGLKAAARDQLVRLFGTSAATPAEDHLMDWSGERYTATNSDLKGDASHPPYGEPALSRDYFGSRLFFAAAESAVEHGGLIEGALQAARRVAEAILDLHVRRGV